MFLAVLGPRIGQLGFKMNLRTFEEKKAYFAKVRKRNYAASLRLEGLDPVSVRRESKASGRHIKKR